MDREVLVRAFYGIRQLPSVWATDCPIRFDVWHAFASLKPPEDRVDVILAANEELGTRRILDVFQMRTMGSTSPIAAGSYVSVQLTLADLITVVVPMTSLRVLASTCRRLPPGTALDLVMDPDFRLEPTDEAGWNNPFLLSRSTIDLAGDHIWERHRERRDQLAWLLILIATVIDREEFKVPQRRSERASGRLERAANLLRRGDLGSESTRPPTMELAEATDRRQRHPVLSVTTNRPASAAVTRSRRTVKADAAEQLFSVDCSTIGWAVVDSGIDAEHPAFSDWGAGPAGDLQSVGLRVVRCFDFVGARRTLSADATVNGLVDWSQALPYVEVDLEQFHSRYRPTPMNRYTGPPPKPYATPVDPHGTHVAGILGGSWPQRSLRGICPTIRLYDFRVLNDEGAGDEFSIVTALQAIRHINEQAGRIVIAGVNLSLSVPHDVANYACGWTPICVECDRLTRSGVVVVTAAGNSGYQGVTRSIGTGYQTVSISDPGNTDSVITVGSTHRSDPHRHGVSYFSSRGPTADGRAKPDILAPGEDIDGPIPRSGLGAMHGTSQAAAHVSGAAAMLIARYRELLGRPERIKEILCSTATDLGRKRDFQGAGLIDILRAMQSV